MSISLYESSFKRTWLIFFILKFCNIFVLFVDLSCQTQDTANKEPALPCPCRKANNKKIGGIQKMKKVVYCVTKLEEN